jgi:hypothetical protein
MSILSLPAELLAEVFGCLVPECVRLDALGPTLMELCYGAPKLPSNDVFLAVGLTCRKFAGASEYFLAGTIRLGVDAKSLAHLENLAAWPNIARGVCAIYLDVGIYDHVLVEN